MRAVSARRAPGIRSAPLTDWRLAKTVRRWVKFFIKEWHKCLVSKDICTNEITWLAILLIMCNMTRVKITAVVKSNS